MGLNIVHMFGLCLPVITHGMTTGHGPEAEYIKHRWNGLLFDTPNNTEELGNAIKLAWSLSKDEMRTLQNNAYSTYVELNTPPLHERILRIIDND
jgi:glycogen synthase